MLQATNIPPTNLCEPPRTLSANAASAFYVLTAPGKKAPLDQGHEHIDKEHEHREHLGQVRAKIDSAINAFGYEYSRRLPRVPTDASRDQLKALRGAA